MCLINFAFKYHTDYPLIVVANRDEFYNRPTESLHWWEDKPNILAGRDLKDGGTWMGITKEGKFAALTNYRDPQHIKENVQSRGELIPMYFNQEISLNTFHEYLKKHGSDYNGFNLIYGDTEHLFYYANKGNRWEEITPGVYGLSNAFLDTPWPKTQQSKEAFKQLLDKNVFTENTMIDLLSDKNLAAENTLPNTGVPPELEKKLSAMFIETENYGTRLTSYLRIDKNQQVHFIEKSFVPADFHQFKFTIK
ncbi:MAG: NRDE family protein [Bacteroidetes bacterium]|nr:NRDE family protein [Bacteroidota bacterium]